MAIIEMKELGFDYVIRGEKAKITEVDRAIDDVNLQIEARSFIAILGYNGSGKSALAKTLNGILLPSDDTVLISGMNIADDTKFLDTRRKVGVVSQNPDNQIIVSLVEDNMDFGPENPDVPTEEIQQRVDAALKTVGITTFRLKSPNHFPDEQKQRVAVTGVMTVHPKCIVLDESTATLDLDGKKEVIRTVTGLNRSEGVMVVLIIYYMREVIGVGRLVVMNDGKVIMDGTPREAFARVEELKRLRLGVPQTTEFTYESKQRGASSPGSVFAIEELAEAILPLWKEN